MIEKQIIDAVISSHHPSAIILCGLPGCGKSTLRNKLLQFDSDEIADCLSVADRSTLKFDVISSDDFIEQKSKDRGITYSQGFRLFVDQAEKHVFEQLRNADKNNIIVDRTNLSVKSRRRVFSALTKHFNKIAVYFDIPYEVIDRRVAERALSAGKNIPAGVLDTMQRSYVYPSVDEGFNQVFCVKYGD
jgi:predicted kinase